MSVVEGNPKDSFSIAITPRCRGGHFSFHWIAPLYPWYVPYYGECLARRCQVPFLKSLVWLDLGLNPGLPVYWRTLYQKINSRFQQALEYAGYISAERQDPTHHVVLVARISLTLSRHFSLSFIASGRSSGLHPVSSHSCWMYVRAGRPAFARPCVGVHKSTSLMSSSLLLQQCPACLVRLSWIVFVIGGRWPYSWCLVGCCRQDLFKIARSILVQLPSSFFSNRFVRVYVVHPSKKKKKKKSWYSAHDAQPHPVNAKSLRSMKKSNIIFVTLLQMHINIFFFFAHFSVAF